MVKNTKGGKNHKKFARKLTTPGPQFTRYSQDPDEIYACCSKIYGPSCDALCLDGSTKLVIIRNKFKGRNKRNNGLRIGTWILIGKRSFTTSVEGKKETCDLLEVYSDMDKKKLMQHEHEKSWNVFNSIIPSEQEKDDLDELGFSFVDADVVQYDELLNSENTEIIKHDEDEDDDDLDINDI